VISEIWEYGKRKNLQVNTPGIYLPGYTIYLGNTQVNTR